MDKPFGQPSHPGEMPSLPAPPAPPNPGGRELAIKVSTGLILLSRVVLIILVVSILAASFPMQPSNPLWYLKLGQIAADYSVTLLFSLALMLLASYIGPRRYQSKGQKEVVRRLVVVSLISYALLVPIQLLTYGLHWRQTAEVNLRASRQAESEAAILVGRIRGANSEQQLRQLLGQAAVNVPSPPVEQLQEQKNKLIEAIDGRLLGLRARLKNDRQQRLTSIAINMIKAVVVAAAMVAGLARLQRLLAQS